MTINLIDLSNQFRIKFETAGTIRSVLSEYKMMGWSDTVIFVCDGHGAKARRQAIYPNYKLKRKPASDDFYKMLDLFKQCLLHTKHMHIEIPGYEADDVIGCIAPSLADSGAKVVIHSTDGDFNVLADGVNVQIYGRKEYAHTPFHEVRLMKALVGDGSDNITGIDGFGPKKWEICDRERWLQFFTDPDCKPCFDSEAGSLGLTKKLVDWIKIEANQKMLKAGWEVAGFYPIEDDLLIKHMHVGIHNDRKLEAILKDFLQ